MAIENRDNLKSYFEHGDKPTQQQFASLIDSSLNSIEDKATLTDVQTGTDDSKFITPSITKQAIETMSPVKSVNGVKPLNGNININTGGGWEVGSVERGILKFLTLNQSGTEIFHLKLPYSINSDNGMYHITAKGYAYGSSDIIDIVWVGYCYCDGHAHLNTKTDVSRSTSITAGQYVGSDSHIYLWFKVPYTYYTSFSIDSMRVGNGNQLYENDIQIIESSQSQL